MFSLGLSEPLIKLMTSVFLRANQLFLYKKIKRRIIMLTSIGLIFTTGLIGGFIFKKIKLPAILGMLLAGILLSPYSFNLLDDSILNISADLRKFALIIILMRAGLTLNISDLKKVGRPAFCMCFLPACFEILGYIAIAPLFLNISLSEAALLGSVIAAVSPAVIVPRMIKLIETGYGTKKGIPQMILAGASADDVFVIVLFSSFTSLVTQGEMSYSSLLSIPISIITGILLGIIAGYIFSEIIKKIELKNPVKIIIILSICFFFCELENVLSDTLPISSLIGVMIFGCVLYKRSNIVAKELSSGFNALWTGGEILLFTLVGALVDIKYAYIAGISVIVLVILCLVFRVIGVSLCLVKTNLNFKERLFCVGAYIPKATVQAAIGGIPLSMGLACGQTILTSAVIAIIITAPLGAIIIDKTYKKVLEKC